MKFYNMSKSDEKIANVSFDGTIGEDWWDTASKTAGDFRDELKELGDVETINVSINSPGGSVFDGVAIYNMLKNHKAKINVVVDGLAASIASVIAMAGDTLTMNTGSMLMIHNPWTIAQGNSKDLRETADTLDKLRDNILSIYTDKTGLNEDDVKQLMDAETWLTSEEAFKQGWVDSTNEQIAVAASIDKDVAKFYQKLPDKLQAEAEANLNDEETPKSKFDDEYRQQIKAHIELINAQQKEIQNG
ncbi:head maturation protease, ClpP-related [Weissella kandleri]|uniref:head maturation protease, ClpP-related n=1 Tax=Weissella kandleri TaxID=1616 RepID=UPI00387E7492